MASNKKAGEAPVPPASVIAARFPTALPNRSSAGPDTYSLAAGYSSAYPGQAIPAVTSHAAPATYLFILH